MRAFWILFLSSLMLTSPRSSWGDTIWERAKWGSQLEEQRMRQSVEKVLLGVGDERDLLQVRVGLITLSRGEVQDPRTIVQLLRLRREMGLSPSKHTMVLLNRAKSGDLSLTERAWVQLEVAHAHLFDRDLGAARMALSEGLELGWRTQVRAEISILRGIVYLRMGDGLEALEDFKGVVSLGGSRRLVVQAQIGQALAFALLGDEENMRVFAREAFITEATRATVSRLDPFWDLELSRIEHQNASALLQLGRSLTLEADEPRDAHRAKVTACSLIEPPEPKDEEVADRKGPRVILWGTEIRRSLRAHLSQTCLAPPPPEAVPLESESPARNDEDHL